MEKEVVSSVVVLVFLVILAHGCAQPSEIDEGAPVEKVTENVVGDAPLEAEERSQPIEELANLSLVAEEIPQKKQTTLTFSRKINVADAIFPGIFFADDNFYVTYNKDGDVYIKKFDNVFNKITEKRLTAVRKVNDVQVAYGDGFFYVVYSTAGKSGTPDKGLYLKKFDLAFDEINEIAVTEEAPETEATNDMFFGFINDLLYVGTFYIPPNPADPENSFGHNIRVFDNELNLKSQIVANDLPHQNGASLVSSNDKFTIISGANVNFNSQSRDLIILSYDMGWNFLHDKVISNEPDDEYWPMGSFFDENTMYVAYTSNEEFNEHFCPTCDMGEIYLKRFDKDWNVIDTTTVEDKFPSHRAHIIKIGDRLFVAYDSSENNQFKVYVKEFVEE